MRVWLALLALASAALTASGCGGTPASSPPSPSASTTGTTRASAAPSTAAGLGPVPGASPEGRESHTGVIPGLTPPPGLEIEPLGAVAFKVDTGRGRTVSIPGDGPETTLSVTDGAGLRWTIVIPDGALTAPATITMEPLAELSSADIRGHLAGGVLLGPDGLQFRIPATLTVSGGHDDGATVLLTGRHDGNGLDVATSLDPSGRSALVSHFSTAIEVDGADPAWVTQLRDTTSAEGRAAVSAALTLIESGEVSVPEPPSIPLECVSEDAGQANKAQLDAFRQAVLEPERSLVTTLIGAAQTRELLGGQDDHRVLIGQLLARLERKADLLIRSYGSQPEKLQALTSVALEIKWLSALAGRTQDSGDALAHRLAVKWDAMVNRVADSLIRDLVGKHDYRKAEALWRVARQAVLVGSGGDSAIWPRIEAALRFRLDVKLKANWSEATWLVQATIPVQYKSDDPSRRFAVGGPEPGEYVALESDVLRSVGTRPFYVTASLKILDACAGTAELKLDRFYGDSETYQMIDDDEAPPVTMPLLKEAFTHAFEKDLRDNLYVFEVKLRNLDATMVDTSIARRPPKATDDWWETLDIVVTHTPRT